MSAEIYFEFLLDESLLDDECKCESEYDKQVGLCTNKVVARVSHCGAQNRKWYLVCSGYYSDQDCASWPYTTGFCECGLPAKICWKVIPV